MLSVDYIYRIDGFQMNRLQFDISHTTNEIILMDSSVSLNKYCDSYTSLTISRGININYWYIKIFFLLV